MENFFFYISWVSLALILINDLMLMLLLLLLVTTVIDQVQLRVKA